MGIDRSGKPVSAGQNQPCGAENALPFFCACKRISHKQAKEA